MPLKSTVSTEIKTAVKLGEGIFMKIVGYITNDGFLG